MDDSTTEPPPPQSMSDDEKPSSMMNVSYGGDTEEVKNNKSLKPSPEKEACDATSGLECKCDWKEFQAHYGRIYITSSVR